MYGIRPDLDLTKLVGTELIQVAIGQYQVILCFHPTGSISIEGRYELRSSDGKLLEAGRPEDFRTKELPNLLGQSITKIELEPPRAFVLQLSGGHSVRFIDDSEQYESFQIQPGDIII